MIDPDAQGEPGRRCGERALGQAQGPLGITEDHDGGSVRRVEHDAARGRELRGGHRHHGLELRLQARLFLDRPSGELLDFQKDDASEGRSRVRCFHLPRTDGPAILPFTYLLRLQSPV